MSSTTLRAAFSLLVLAAGLQAQFGTYTVIQDPGDSVILVGHCSSNFLRFLPVSGLSMLGSNVSVSAVITPLDTRLTVDPMVLSTTMETGVTAKFCGTVPGPSMPSLKVTVTARQNQQTLPVDNFTVTLNITVVAVTAGDTNSAASVDPISTATGELYDPDIAADLSLGGPLPLLFQRYYGSLLKANGITMQLGANWMHNFDWSLSVTATQATVTMFGGKTVAFQSSGNTWRLVNPERLGYQL